MSFSLDAGSLSDIEPNWLEVPNYIKHTEPDPIDDERKTRKNQAWHNLAVGLWAMYRSTLNLSDTGDLCYPPWLFSGEFDRKKLVFFAPPPECSGLEDSTGCSSSNWPDKDDDALPNPPSQYGGEIPAVVVGVRLRKSTISHELGYVIVMMRSSGPVHPVVPDGDRRRIRRMRRRERRGTARPMPK
jgi:hypothetical protein